jgi:hypothetical protein
MSVDHFVLRGESRSDVLLFVPSYGPTERLELSVQIPIVYAHSAGADSESGVGNVNVVAKLLLAEEGETAPAFAVKAVVNLPSVDNESAIGYDAFAGAFSAVASKRLGDLTFHAMAGMTVVEENPVVRDSYFYGLAADYALTEAVHLAGEVVGGRSPDRLEATQFLTGMLGLMVSTSDRVTLDGGVRIGITEAAPDWSATLGATLSF